VNALVGLDPPWSSNRAARALLEHALMIKEKALGPDHTSVALTLTTLANVDRKLGQPERARPLYERALTILEKALGPSHPRVADTLDRLGESLAEAGDYTAARAIYERVLAITETVHGPDHPEVGVIRQHTAEVLGMMGDAPGALRMALEAERVGRDHLRLIGRTLPEREALMYAGMRPVGLDVALTLLARDESRRQVSSASVWDAVVRSRAVVLDEMASRHRTVGMADQADVGRLVNELRVKREHLARLVVRGPEGSGEQYRLELDRARGERDDAERALAERSLAFRQEQSQRRVGLEDVNAALPPQSALIAFVRYLQLPFGQQSRGSVAGSQPVAAYLAFVIREGDAGNPAVVPLGRAADLDDEIARWRREMAAVALAGGRSTARSEAAARRSGALLRAKIWDPFTSKLAGASRIFIVPEGPLHLVNWATLPIASTRYLIEQAPPLHYLSAERDLVPAEQSGHGQGLLVVDSPVFNERPALAAPVSDATAARSNPATAPTGSGVFRSATPDCGDLGWLRFDPLPASAIEAETIVRIWRRSHDNAASGRGATSESPAPSDSSGVVLRLSGRSATEAAFKRRAAGTRVLHLATHGFFLGGRCSAPAQTAGNQSRDAAQDSGARENPLLLAGFALTGANRREVVRPDDEDGILTAEEVATLDLRGVEWAVLSACDTGVGEVRAGEGVFGLRRAFQVAGARTVIMSLWPVDDEDTRRWMTGVYERRFARGADTMEAVRESGLEQLRRRRQAGLSTHPFYWGGFIAAGDWR
jgi:CHAT domain-containing protein/tetratricopeptide (TPR) repeat protein